MSDLTNIRLSKEANDVAEKLVETGKFEDVITTAKFAMGYAIKNYYGEFDPVNYTIPDSNGSNYNIGTVDKDGRVSMILRELYPGLEEPYKCARALMVYGLMRIGEVIEAEGIPMISSLC